MNQLKTVLLLGVLTTVLVALGGMLGEGYMVGALVLAMVLDLGAYFFSDRVVLAMHRAREVDPRQAPRLHAIVDELAGRAGIPAPRVFLIEEPQPNAFATGRDPAHGVVAVTTGLLDLLSEREIRAVIAHELAHIRNRDVLVATIAAAIAGAITWVAHALQWTTLLGGRSDDESGSPLGGLVVALVAPLAATLVQLGISRSREYLADEAGARIADDPEALASALQALERAARHIPSSGEPATASLFIVNPLSGSTFSRLFSTHPSTRQRVARLMAMARGSGRGRRAPPATRLHPWWA